MQDLAWASALEAFEPPRREPLPLTPVVGRVAHHRVRARPRRRGLPVQSARHAPAGRAGAAPGFDRDSVSAALAVPIVPGARENQAGAPDYALRPHDLHPALDLVRRRAYRHRRALQRAARPGVGHDHLRRGFARPWDRS